MNVEDYNEFILNDIILEDVEDAVDQMDIPQDVLEQRNPFELSGHKFITLFRVTKVVCRDIIGMVTPFVEGPTRRSALTITTKVLATLRFFASGSYQEVTGSNSFIGISQPSISRTISEITSALNTPEIFNGIIRFPQTIQELEAIGTRFYEAYQMPGVCGCVDCTHVAIVAPHINDPNFPEHIYVNRKHYHSLNIQLVCDMNLKILNVNSRFPGSAHDSHIWRQSAVSTFMEITYRRNPNNIFFLLGDSGYPTRPWLLTPLGDPQNIAEERFNNRLCSIRSLIERCNGVLKNRFRCLLKYRTLHYSPTVAGKIVNACCVLHNLCIDNNIPVVDEPHVVEPDYGVYGVDNYADVARAVNPDLAAARALQQNIIINHFND